MRRAIRVVKKDGSYQDLEIVKATAIRADVGILHLDKMQKGWRLIFSEDIEKDFSKIERFEIIRKD